MKTKAERSCKVANARVEGRTLIAEVQIRGGLKNMSGDRINWETKMDFPLEVRIDLTELTERYAADRKIALARSLRNTSPDFIDGLNYADKAWTEEQIITKAAPYQVDEEKLEDTIEKLHAKIAALQAKKSAR